MSSLYSQLNRLRFVVLLINRREQSLLALFPDRLCLDQAKPARRTHLPCFITTVTRAAIPPKPSKSAVRPPTDFRLRSSADPQRQLQTASSEHFFFHRNVISEQEHGQASANGARSLGV